jgi:hypothetical protein
METPRDICYCAYEECDRMCERNTKYHDFRNQIMTQSLFNTVDGWTEENCEYFMEFEFDVNNLPEKLIDFIINE